MNRCAHLPVLGLLSLLVVLSSIAVVPRVALALPDASEPVPAPAVTPESDFLLGSLIGAPPAPAEGDAADTADAAASDEDTGLGELAYQGPDGIRPEPRPGGRPLRLYRNATVNSLIRYFTEQKRDVVERGWRRSGRYLEMIRRVFSDEGVPPELAYLAAVESNFNPTARSPAGAVGLWQFMAPTARKFGLRMHRPWYDERLDPESSTHAAARLLAYLYDRYESWELALSAYNAGEARVNTAVEHARSAGRAVDYWKLRLPGQTRGYVPAFLAIAAIMEAPAQYGLAAVPRDEPLPSEALNIALSTTLSDLARRLALPAEALERRNPAWRTRMIPPLDVGPVLLRVPPGTAELLVADLAREAPRPVPWLIHRVQEGETVSAVAVRYGLRTRDVLSLNGLRWSSTLAIGQPLLLPLPADGEPLASAKPVPPLVAAPEHGVAPAESQMHLHRVRAGESLWSISRQYGVRMTDLRLWNRLPDAVIRPDQELVVFLRDAWTAAR